jgi:hypothetical protein
MGSEVATAGAMLVNIPEVVGWEVVVQEASATREADACKTRRRGVSFMLSWVGDRYVRVKIEEEQQTWVKQSTGRHIYIHVYPLCLSSLPGSAGT